MKQLASLITICVISMGCFAKNYPESRGERELREIGSILGPEGLVVRPFKKGIKTEVKDHDREDIVNKYLWQAAIKSLDFIPIISADIQSGTIITDWHVDQDLKHRIKIVVIINQSKKIINLSAIDVKVHSQILKGQLWVNDKPNNTMKTIVQNDIIRRAKELSLKK